MLPSTDKPPRARAPSATGRLWWPPATAKRSPAAKAAAIQPWFAAFPRKDRYQQYNVSKSPARCEGVSSLTVKEHLKVSCSSWEVEGVDVICRRFHCFITHFPVAGCNRNAWSTVPLTGPHTRPAATDAGNFCGRSIIPHPTPPSKTPQGDGGEQRAETGCSAPGAVGPAAPGTGTFCPSPRPRYSSRDAAAKTSLPAAQLTTVIYI